MRNDGVIVVFGCRHEKEFFGRVIKAADFVLLNNIDPVFIFTGIDAFPSVAKSKIKIDKIIWEDKSTTTEENVANVLKMMPQPVFGVPNGLNVIIVSSWYHIQKLDFY